MVRSVKPAVFTAPLQWLGARSYSLYLWHWPALVFTGLVVADHRIAVPVGLAIAVATATAAHAFVEEPIHSGRALAGQLEGNWTIAATAIAVMGLFCLLVGAQFVVVPLPASAAVASMGDRLRRATMDHGENAAAHCHLRPEETVQPPCVFGATGGTHRAVLFGDSHASQWFAPLDSAAKRAGWRLNAWTKSSCPSLDMPIWLKPKRVDFMACQTWREDVLLRLTGTEKPDLVVLSNLTDYSGWVRDAASSALLSRSETLSRWRKGFLRQIGYKLGS